MKQRILSILMTLCLCLTLLPAVALAEGETITEIGSDGFAGHLEDGSLKPGSYKLTDNITLSETLTVTGTVTLDLNGHTLSGANGSKDVLGNSNDGGTAITVQSGGALTIKDTSTGSASGSIVGGNGDDGSVGCPGGNGGAAITVEAGGSLTVSSGTIKGGNGGIGGYCSNGGGGGAAITVNGGSLNVSGGQIVGGNGSNGRDGGGGGSGGSGIEIKIIGGIVNIDGGEIKGGNGSNGSNGSYGGSGGAGGNGLLIESSSVSVGGSVTVGGSATISGGTPGNGGDGNSAINGDGNFGGAGGNGLLIKGGSVSIDGGTFRGTNGANGGSGSSGGNGGNGGSGLRIEGGSVDLGGGEFHGANCGSGGSGSTNGSNGTDGRDISLSGESSITLTGDIALQNTLICKDATLTLDLNGHVLSFANSKKLQLEETTAEPHTTVTLIDSDPTATHTDTTLPKGGVVDGDILLTRGDSTDEDPVTLHANGGTVTGTVTLCSTAKIDCTSNTPTAFKGNVADGYSLTCTGKIFGGIFYGTISDYTQIKSSAITFMNGSTRYAFEVVNSGAKAVAPTDPTAPTVGDYAFGGWYTEETDGTKFDFTNTTISSNITLYARWVPIYTVTFDLNDAEGTAPAEQKILKGQTATEPEQAPTAPTGYTFGGWYKEAACTNEWNFTTDTVTAATTLYAKWTAIDYKITYALNGGTNASTNPSSYTVESADITLANPTRSGYVFTGWSGTGLDGEDNLTVTIAKGSTGNRSYTAHWRAIVASKPLHDVDVKAGLNGSVSVNQDDAREGTIVTVTVTPDSGYALDELTVVDASGNALTVTRVSGNKYSFVMPATDVTVRATFTDGTSTGFVDVPASKYFYNAVNWAVANGITSGVDATHFSPYASCTRGQLVTFLWRAAGCPAAKATENAFSDVKESSSFYKAILWAAENGIVNGYSDGTFKPNAAVSRQQTAAILYRYAKYAKMDVSVGEDTNILSFNDALSVSEYAISAFQWAVGEGVITGNAGNLLPYDICTRAQIVTMLYRLLAK